MKNRFTKFMTLLIVLLVLTKTAAWIVRPEPAPQPGITRIEAHAIIDQAFDLIEASANRMVLQPANALRSDLSPSQPAALSTPEKLTQ